MKRFMAFGWMFWGWVALAPGAIPVPPSSLQLSWFTIEGSSCCSTVGSLQLYGVAGQPDVGTLTATPLLFAGGFLLPGDPVIGILSPAQPVVWGTGEWVDINCWADVPVTGNQIRLELWRNQKKVKEFMLYFPVTQTQTYPLQAPNVTPGSGYSLRAVSERLERIGNPNPWVETSPMITIFKRNRVDPRNWSLYD